MVPFIGRSAWGALPPNRPTGYMSTCTAIVLHHTVTGQPTTVGEATAIVQQIDRQHLAAREPDGRPTYSDIAYNLIVGPGCVFVGRGPTANDGATDNDVATDTVSVSVLGDYRTDPVRPKYRDAIFDAVRLCRDVWGPLPVRPHHDFYATTCPGPNLDALIASLNEDLEDGGPMNDTDMRTLAGYIVDALMTHPVEVHEWNFSPPKPYPTNFAGWLDFMHGEAQQQRLKP